MTTESKVRELLALAGIEVNGSRPYDIQVVRQRFYGRVLAHTSLGFGESYMDGDWDCEQPDELIKRIISERLEEKVPRSPELIWLALKSKITNQQTISRSKRVAKIHYDQTDLNLITYQEVGSCAYWKEGITTLAEAQEAKFDLICQKLDLQPDDILLDIGCGWGAFLAHAVEHYGIRRGIGLTISEGQAGVAQERHKHLPIEFRVEDWRNYRGGQVDKIASMGMFEHVGGRNYRKYFEMANQCLSSDDGRFLLHTIWGGIRYNHATPWIDKYIFPGGALPTPGQLLSATEGYFNVVEDVQNFGVHYDRTLMAWWENFKAHRPEMVKKYGERFCRGWEFYLFSCAGAFRSRSISVGQYLLSPYGIPGGYKRP